MTLRKSVVPAALALAGCFSSESEAPPAHEQVTYHTPAEGGECEVEEVVHHLYAEVVQGGALEKRSVRPSTLVVTVGESSSVVQCGADLVRVAMPGRELARGTFGGGLGSFELDVPAVVIGGHRPAIWVRALLDENGNGLCDEGELSGEAELDESELEDFTIGVVRDGCAGRS